MCDTDQLKSWTKRGLSRRQFTATGVFAALAACAPRDSSDGNAAGAMVEETAKVPTEAGTMDGVLLYQQGKASPAVIFWPDIAGIREAKLVMARRLALAGYAVLLVNPYYRDSKAEVWSSFGAFMEDGGFQKVKPWRAKLTAAAIKADAASMVSWLDDHDAVDSSLPIGAQGYCMGGPFAMWSAAAVPSRVKAAASFHGGGLVREGDPASPHLTFTETKANYLIAIAQDDDAEGPEAKTVLSQAAKAAGRPAEVEVYAADHGWTVPDSPAYNEAEAERAWDALGKLYASAG